MEYKFNADDVHDPEAEVHSPNIEDGTKDEIPSKEVASVKDDVTSHAKFALFKSLHDKNPTEITLAEYHARQAAGEWDAQLEAVANGVMEKKDLPFVVPAGTFAGGRKGSDLVEHSGLGVLDLDGKDNPKFSEEGKLKEYADTLMQDGFVQYVSPSASSTGLAVWIEVDPENRVKALVNFSEYVRQGYNLKADPDCTHEVSRARFVSPAGWEPPKDSSTLFGKYDLVKVVEKPKQKPVSGTPLFADDDRTAEVVSALEYVDGSGHVGWRNVGMALKAEGISYDVFDEWSKTQPNYDAEDNFAQWQGFDESGSVRGGATTMASIFKIAIDSGWEEPPVDPEMVAAWLKYGEAMLAQNKEPLRVSGEYEFTNEEGTLLYRLTIGADGKYRRERPDPKNEGKWLAQMRGVTGVVYNLPSVIAAKESGDPVFFCVTPDDAKAVIALGLVGTCIHTEPAGKDLTQTVTDQLAGCEVVVLATTNPIKAKYARNLVADKGWPAIHIDAKTVAEWGGTATELLELTRDPVELPEVVVSEVTTSKEEVKWAYEKVAAYLMKGGFSDANRVPVVRFYKGDIYYYHGHGWAMMSDAELEGVVLPRLRQFKSRHMHQINKALIANTMMHLKSLDCTMVPIGATMPCWLPEGEPAKNLISFRNKKIVDILKLVERNPDCTAEQTPQFFSNDHVDYDYDPDATCPMFMTYLNRVLPDPVEREFAQKMVGLALLDNTDFDVFFILVGVGQNGKTVFLEIIAPIIGRQNVSNVDLELLAKRFQTEPLTRTKLNISGELSPTIQSGDQRRIEAKLKAVCSGEELSAEKKNQHPHDLPCRSRFVMACNAIPFFIDKSVGFWRRPRILEFSVQIPLEEQDLTLSAKIVNTELSGVFNWAVEGARLLLADGRFKESPNSIRLKEAHRAACDHEKTFLSEEGYSAAQGATQPSNEVYNHYKEWCRDNGNHPLGMGKFYLRVSEIHPSVMKKKVKVGGESKWCLSGLFRSETYSDFMGRY